MTRRRSFLFLGLVLLLLAGAAAWQVQADRRDGKAAYDRGVAALGRGDARTARIELLNAIRAEPRSVAVRMAQARALVELEDGAAAQAEVERARALGASAAATRVPLAQALLLQGDVDAALAQATAADVDPRDRALASRIAGRAWLSKGDMVAASAAFEKALALAPGQAEGWIDLGRYRLAAGDQAGAIIAADRAVVLAPQSAEAIAFRGEMTRGQYGLAAALPWFERALALAPDHVPTLTDYAATLADMGEAGRMLSVTRHILLLEPGHPRAYLMQAVMAARAEDYGLARALLGRTQGALDDEPATMLLRGVLHLQEGNAVLAADPLGRLVAMQPDNRQARILLGRAQMEAGDLSAAAATLTPLVVQGDADPYTLTLAARVQEGLGDRSMAEDMLGRAAWPVRPAAAIFTRPGDAALLDQGAPPSSATAGDNIPYIRALMNGGRLDEAADRARLLARANPGAPDAQILWGDALGHARRWAEAARAYEAAANIRFSQNAALRLANAWARAGDPARARQVMTLFLTQNPASLEGRRLAGAMALEAGDWRTARRLLEAVRAQAGDNDALLMAGLARAAMEVGDGGQARILAAHAYRLLPGNPVTADIYGWVLTRSGAKGMAAIDLLEKAAALAPGHPLIRAHLAEAYGAAGRTREALAMRRGLAAS